MLNCPAGDRYPILIKLVPWIMKCAMKHLLINFVIRLRILLENGVCCNWSTSFRNQLDYFWTSSSKDADKRKAAWTWIHRNSGCKQSCCCRMWWKLWNLQGTLMDVCCGGQPWSQNVAWGNRTPAWHPTENQLHLYFKLSIARVRTAGVILI